MSYSRCTSQFSLHFATLACLLVVSLAGRLPLVEAQDDAAAPTEAAAEPAADAPESEAAVEQQLSPAEQQAAIEKALDLKFTPGPAQFALGTMAQIDLPADYAALDGDGARRMLQAFGNLTGDDEVGLVQPTGGDWFVVFEFSPEGYVKDDDKDALDAPAMMKSMTDNQEASNAARREQKLNELELAGWVMEPNYNPTTHNLQWAIRIRDKTEGGESVNHFTRLLGRRGVMQVTLVCDPGKLDALLPAFNTLLSGYSFVQGEDYASYRAGDKVAEYGLAALVTGGAAAAAYKTGLLAKLGLLFAKAGKAIVVGVIALIAAGAKLLGLRKKSA